jgi:hypothetical protein
LIRVVPVSFLVLTASALLASSLVGSMIGFLAVIFIGSYVRRFGRLGLDLGVTAFLSYYLAQFAHLDIASLPAAWGAWSVAVVTQVFAHAMTLSGVAVGSRTGVPRTELPIARAAALSHAAQVTAAAGLSILGGFAVSPSLWWWGVATSWPIFINADHPRAVVRRSGQRLAGTALGLMCGGALVTLTDLGTAALGALLLIAIFGIFAADGHYGRVTWFITIALILTLELPEGFLAADPARPDGAHRSRRRTRCHRRALGRLLEQTEETATDVSRPHPHRRRRLFPWSTRVHGSAPDFGHGCRSTHHRRRRGSPRAGRHCALSIP